MYNGKHLRKRRLRWRKEFVLTCSIVLLVIGMVGGSIAYLFTNTEAVTNTFTAPEVDVTIPEEFDKETKEHVKVSNSCDFDVYARATYVAYWIDKDGNVVPEQLAAGTHYTIEIGDDWTESVGYWYYTSKLAANSQTTDFIVTCAPIDAATPDDYRLVVDVIGEVVQAEPVDAIVELWGEAAAEAVGAK